MKIPPHDVPPRSARLSGTIDIWWLVADGGLLLLLPFLLKKHKTWRGCRTRLFAVAPPDGEEAEELKRDLDGYIRDFRLDVEVHVRVLEENVHWLRASSASSLMEGGGRLSWGSAGGGSTVGGRRAREDSCLLQSSMRDPLLFSTESSTQGDGQSLSSPKGGKRDSASSRLPHNSSLHFSTDRFPHHSFCSRPDILRASVPTLLRSNSLLLPQSTSHLPQQTPSHLPQQPQQPTTPPTTVPEESPQLVPDTTFLHTKDQLTSSAPCCPEHLALATALNEVMVRESEQHAELVVVNLPDLPACVSGLGWFQLVEELTKNIKRCLLVRGTQTEVITAFS